MRITNLNPDPEIGASAWLVDLEGHRLLLDAGMHPKREGRAGLPLYHLADGKAVEAVAVSHCHHDHVGALPVALRHFPAARALMTELSYFLVERVLHNSVNVMLRQREELGLAEYPLYTHTEVDELAPRFQGCRYNREVLWASPHHARPGHAAPTLEFHDAGHVLGAAGISVRGRRDTLFYTGDVCFHDQTLQRGACFEDAQADVLILETTRGNRATPPGFRREAELERLAGAIQRVLKRKGSVLLPAFAMGRTQEMLALLALLMEEGRLKRQPVFIGGLGRVFTEIYDLTAHRTHRQHSGLELHDALDLSVLEPRELRQIKLSGRLFVLTSGMMNANTASWQLAQRMIEDERQAIFFVGYADPDSPGGRLRATRRGEAFSFGDGLDPLRRQCEVESFDLTAHANRDDLLAFVGEAAPRVVVLGHGNHDSQEWFARRIRARHPRVKVLRPAPGETVEV